MPTVQVEAASLGGLSSLSIRSDVRGASVWLDYQLRGSVPLDLTGIAPGSHQLVLRASGYYDASITISLAADTKTTVTTSLQLITGFLDVRADPPSATVLVDGTAYSPGIIEVPAGQRTVTVQSFGYIEQSFSVYVPERLFATVTAMLEKAPFEASDFSLSRERFNPRNSGLKGIATASFYVTAAGDAELTVLGPDGVAIRSAKLDRFDDWEQSYSWDGRDDEGTQVPDGSYAIEATIRPAPDVESLRESYVFSSAVIVDSSLVVVTTGAYGAMYGSMHAPEAFAPATDGFKIDAFGYASRAIDGTGAISGGATLSAAGQLAMGLDTGVGLEIRGDSATAARLGLRVSAPLSAPFGVAALLEGRISDAATGNPAWARLGVTLGAGTPFLNVVAMPHIGAYWEDGLSARAGLGAACSASGYNIGASLSAQALSGSLADGVTLSWPVETALELRFSPARLPLSFRLVGGIAWSPAPTSWSAGFGLSGGF